jgi:hypothetical protein
VNIQHPSSGNRPPDPDQRRAGTGTYAMLLAGLGAVGFVARRRKA